jgi:hypothetical protein
MKNPEAYGENHHLKVDTLRLKSKIIELKLKNEELEKQLNSRGVSCIYSAKDVEDAYRDGYENKYPDKWDFNINNYINL